MTRPDRIRVLLIDGEWKDAAYGSLLGDPSFEFRAIRSSDFSRLAPDAETDVILLDDDYGSLANSRLPAWSEAGVPSVQVADGILDWKNSFDYIGWNTTAPTERFSPVLADVVVCLGDWQAQWLARWGARCALDIGLPRLDGLSVLRRPASPATASPCRALVCSANTPGFTPNQINLARQAFEDLLEFARSSDEADLRFDWRISAAAREQLALPFPDQGARRAHDQILDADIVITQPSTIALEAMAMGKPTALLDYGSYPRLLLCAYEIGSARQIVDTFRSLRSNDRFRLRHQDDLLELQCATDGSAAARLSALLIHLTDIRRSGRLATLDLPAELSRHRRNRKDPLRPPAGSEFVRQEREVAQLRNALAESGDELSRIHASRAWRALHAVKRWLPIF